MRAQGSRLKAQMRAQGSNEGTRLKYRDKEIRK
jgi:hypothetical protein